MHLVIPLTAVGVLLLLGQPVMAQSLGGHEGPKQERTLGQERPSSAPTNLPDWAEPSSPSNDRSDGALNPEGVQTNDAPDFPGGGSDPEQVPVDGGLALLAAAGAGYAVRKLREEDDGEDALP